jgi:transcriptional regulator with XRE-family HTH domain
MDPLTEAVARNIERILAEKKMSQRQLALGAGLHPNTINRFLAGGQSMGLDTLYAIAATLEVAVDDLIGSNTEETAALIARYRSSPWFQIDKPSADEMRELAGPSTVRVVGASGDEEAVHYTLLAIRKRRQA